MAGPLTLPGAPTTDNQAATKKYVDDTVGSATDYVQKSGDTMIGPLTLSGDPTANLQAATKQYVDSLAPKDFSGNPVKVVCGLSSASAWQNYADPDAVYTDVDTRVGGVAAFSATPMYFTNIACTAGCWRSMGAQAIYNASPTGFRVFVQDFNPEILDRNLALTWGYQIKWCGFGR